MAALDMIDKFQIIDHLGSGNFGQVFLCFDPYLKINRAVKIIKVPDPSRFVAAVKEGQVLEFCRHRHIVDVKEVRSALYKGEPVVMIVMEYLAHGSLQKLIEKRFISVNEACKITMESLLGLEHAHNKNVLHRDIKPGNIMFGDCGEAKLSDFGLAIDYHAEPSNIMGYRPHQPLEVIQGSPMDKLSDIYAMGITFFRLLNNTNSIDFNFKTTDEWLKAVKKDQFPKRVYQPHIPDKIIRILNKSIHKKRNIRFEDCISFRQTLEKLSFAIDWTRVDNNLWLGKKMVINLNYLE